MTRKQISSRTLRLARKGIDYAKLNSQGSKASRKQDSPEQLEDGQLVDDSPLRVHASEDEYSAEPSVVESRMLQQSPGTDLDYYDETNESVVEIKDGAGENEGDRDLGVDEVWQREEENLATNRQKMDRLKKRLQRQCQLEEAKLQEEQERVELVRMEREIIELKQQRSVVHSFPCGSAGVSRDITGVPPTGVNKRKVIDRKLKYE